MADGTASSRQQKVGGIAMRAMIVILAGVVMAAGAGRGADVEVGATAPCFTLTDVHGNRHGLSDFKGKTVVLEWTNYDCPFVRKHYGTENMQKLQEKYIQKQVVWLSICSSAPGKQGHYSPEIWREKIKQQGSKATAVLLDADGKVGRLYGAKTTPHMFVIGGDGLLRYRGAIDDNRAWDPKTVEGATNYVAAALDALLKGEAVAVQETQSYGCSVKY